jgi:hypothetical protein
MIRDIKEKDPTFFKQIKNMPLRARVGRKNGNLNNSTISFVKDAKRDAFIYINSKDEIEELTFLETIKKFEADVNEKGIPLHSKHHEQVKAAIQTFTDKIEEEKAKDKKVDVTQGPNEKRAIAYLDAMINLPFTNDEETELIITAKEAIRKGKFQNLQRDINKLKRAVGKSPLKPVIILEKIIEILKSYPLKTPESEDEGQETVVASKILNPEIIITESFSK